MKRRPAGVPLLNLLLALQRPSEYRTAINILLVYTALILIEVLGLLGILRWRMHRR